MATPNIISMQKRNRIRQLYEEGATIVAISVETGVAAGSITYIVRDLQRRQTRSNSPVIEPVNPKRYSPAAHIRERFAPGCQPRYGR